MKLDKPLKINFEDQKVKLNQREFDENFDFKKDQKLKIAPTPEKKKSEARDLENELKEVESLSKIASELKKENKKLQWRILQHGDNFNSFVFHMESLFRGKHITYVDVGAYTGEVAFQVINSQLKVREAHIFEPNPYSYKELEGRVEKIRNECKCQFFLYPMAASDKETSTKISINGTMSRVIKLEQTTESDSFQEVQSTTLDKAKEAFTEEHISILKVDVEGHEMAVLHGADELLHKQSVDVIYVEVGLNKEGKQQTYFRLIDDFMNQYGYKIYRFYEQQNQWMDDSPVLRRMNVAYISQRFADKSPVNLINEINILKKQLAEK